MFRSAPQSRPASGRLQPVSGLFERKVPGSCSEQSGLDPLSSLSSCNVEFLTEPKHHATEIRCYMRDPDGYLIEVGQSYV